MCLMADWTISSAELVWRSHLHFYRPEMLVLMQQNARLAF